MDYSHPIDTEKIISATRTWLERSVIGLDLCPFAAAPLRAGRVRMAVTAQRTAIGLLDDFRRELLLLQTRTPADCETTLLIHPWVLSDFGQYNDFLEACETAIAEMDLEGEIQVASFHPEYQFAGTQPQDIENFSNRSPFPMLHLLREASVERAAASCDTEAIYRKNIQTLRDLGHAGWRRLWLDPPA